MSAPSNSLQQPRDNSSSCRLHPIRATVPCQPDAGVVEPRTAEAPVPLPVPHSFREVQMLSKDCPPNIRTPPFPQTPSQGRTSAALVLPRTLPLLYERRATQTLWIDEGAEQGGPHQRSASWGSADHLKEIAKLRLQHQAQHGTACPSQYKGMSSATTVPVPKSLICWALSRDGNLKANVYSNIRPPKKRLTGMYIS
ncbi:hypothetical protein CgunFtcFv8_018202 [Champsocephalus gunnari]|uniref:Uncharacterized protein n=1 Tax=Champsocephalus gunnari TaxID=52237 RepID=A0AAN8DSF1_CHAGU|nr:hypothetical protein CgunFtcFv8_018202 [Champsocephalus gunnari]